MSKTAIATQDEVDRDIIPMMSEEDLAAMSESQILAMFEKTLNDIYLKVAEAGFLLLELERRGYDTMKMRRRPIVQAVRDVAVGMLAREAFANYYGRSDILRCMTALPIEKQTELVNVGSVAVYDSANGKDTHRLIEISELCPEEVRLVFDVKNHKVREPEEQKALLRVHQIKEAKKKGKISHDERTGLIDASDVTAEEIVRYAKKNGLL